VTRIGKKLGTKSQAAARVLLPCCGVLLLPPLAYPQASASEVREASRGCVVDAGMHACARTAPIAAPAHVPGGPSASLFIAGARLQAWGTDHQIGAGKRGAQIIVSGDTFRAALPFARERVLLLGGCACASILNPARFPTMWGQGECMVHAEALRYITAMCCDVYLHFGMRSPKPIHPGTLPGDQTNLQRDRSAFDPPPRTLPHPHHHEACLLGWGRGGLFRARPRRAHTAQGSTR